MVWILPCLHSPLLPNTNPWGQAHATVLVGKVSVTKHCCDPVHGFATRHGFWHLSSIHAIWDGQSLSTRHSGSGSGLGAIIWIAWFFFRVMMSPYNHFLVGIFQRKFHTKYTYVRGILCSHLQSMEGCTRISLGDFELSKTLQQHKGFVNIDVGIL